MTHGQKTLGGCLAVHARTVQFPDTVTIQFSATLEDSLPSSPGENGVVFTHSAGVLSMMGKTAVLSMLDTRGAVDAGRCIESPGVEYRGERSYIGGREQLTAAM